MGQFYEIGGPEPLTYRRMMMTVGRLMGYQRVILPVPLLSPRLSSQQGRDVGLWELKVTRRRPADSRLGRRLAGPL